jgi:hypothetical protein
MRVWMQNYAVKAWPCIIIWFKIAYELIFNNFTADKWLPLATKADRTDELKPLSSDRKLNTTA